MKIAFILPSLKQTGPGIVVRDLSEGLVNKGYECKIYYFDSEEFEMEMPCPVQRISFNKPFDFENWDIIHSHMFRPDLYVYRFRKLLKDKNLITTLHNPITYKAIKTTYSFLQSFIGSKLWNKSLYIFDNIVVLNAITHFELINKGHKNVSIIYNGRDCNDMENFNYPNDLKDFVKGYKIIGSTSSLTKRKGLDQIIKALPLLPEYKLILIGEGPLKLELQKLAKELKVEDRVYFTGFVKNPIPIMKLLDIFILPSYSEGFPLAVIEASSLKIPTILSNIPILESLIPPSCGEFFKINNINDLVRKIRDIDPLKGKNLYNFYLQNLTKEIMTNNYITLYKLK